MTAVMVSRRDYWPLCFLFFSPLQLNLTGIFHFYPLQHLKALRCQKLVLKCARRVFFFSHCEFSNIKIYLYLEVNILYTSTAHQHKEIFLPKLSRQNTGILLIIWVVPVISKFHDLFAITSQRMFYTHCFPRRQS